MIAEKYPDGMANSRVYNPIPEDCGCIWLLPKFVPGGMLMTIVDTCPVHGNG